jgi:hypothetical protein
MLRQWALERELRPSVPVLGLSMAQSGQEPRMRVGPAILRAFYLEPDWMMERRVAPPVFPYYQQLR